MSAAAGSAPNLCKCLGVTSGSPHPCSWAARTRRGRSRTPWTTVQAHPVVPSCSPGPAAPTKAVILNAVEDVARTRGCFVLSETTRDGVARDLAHTTIPALLREHSSDASQSHLCAVAVNAAGFGGGVTRERVERHHPSVSLRSQLEALTTLAASRGTGVLITLDEAHGSAITDLWVLAQAVHDAFREGRDVTFAGAGLLYTP